MRFDGVDDYVNLGDNQNLLQNVSGATIATWVRVPAGVNGYRKIFTLTKSIRPTEQRFDLSFDDGAGIEGMISAGASSSGSGRPIASSRR
jgi:hypothetical protein